MPAPYAQLAPDILRLLSDLKGWTVQDLSSRLTCNEGSLYEPLFKLCAGGYLKRVARSGKKGRQYVYMLPEVTLPEEEDVQAANDSYLAWFTDPVCGRAA